MFIVFLSAIVLSVLPRFQDYDYPFGIFKLFFENQTKQNTKQNQNLFPNENFNIVISFQIKVVMTMNMKGLVVGWLTSSSKYSRYIQDEVQPNLRTKRGHYYASIVSLSKHDSHYGPRSVISYYNLITLGIASTILPVTKGPIFSFAKYFL